jgi:carbamoyltransferase
VGSTVGVSALAHDAAIAVMRDSEIVFAAHAERYSHTKNDRLLNHAIVDEALTYAGEVERVVYYERPLLKKTRQLRAGQLGSIRTISPRSYLKQFPQLGRCPLIIVPHHRSHAAGAYFTSPYREAAVVVVDAIGEWQTLSVWRGSGNRLTRIHSVNYPHSIGLLYSAFTQRAGLKPNEEEYILMGMAAYGEPRYRDLIRDELIADWSAPVFRLRRALHTGLGNWHPEITDNESLACSVQSVIEEYLLRLFTWVAATIPARNLVYTGGVALNCVFNGKLAEKGLFDSVWIPPNPGDAGSALGAVLADHGDSVRWPGPYLGHDIRRELDVGRAAKELAAGRIIGLANGRAEYGPRALGNRSLLADPRRPDTKDRVNVIKRRQRFRPFAPAIMVEYANEYFEMPTVETPYMQYVVRCRDPGAYPAICHVDGTSRVQTVSREQNPTFYSLLEMFRDITGCPMLLNTSLNIRGEPLVNTWEDALRFGRFYDIPIY